MATVFSNSYRGPQESSIAPGIVLMVAALLIAAFAFLLGSDLTDSFPYIYLLPWITVLAMVLAAPAIYLYFKGRFVLHDPLLHATWSYFLPAFVVGGFMLASGWSQPHFLTFIQDASYNLPYTVVLIILGYGGLATGYLSPIGKKAGALLGSFLPTKDFESSALLIPGLFLLVLGTLNTVGALFLGIIGYQRSEATEAYSGIIFLTTLFFGQGSFIVWYLVFRIGKFDSKSVLLIVFLLATTITRALFAGNRSALLQSFIVVLLAYTLSGRKFTVRRSVITGGLMTACLMAGMIYGTVFRTIKGSETRVSFDQYTENVFDTVDQVSTFDLKNNVEFGLASLAVRLDTLSSVAVVVSTYEQLEPYEESYGLDNNIWKDVSTFLVPRVLWNDKPVASEARKYSDLYFNYGENSFAITPIGDLLRNYGPIGVPVGMFLLGLLLRVVYRSLIEDQPRTMWRTSMFYMLLVTVSYESFYGLIVPFGFKVLCTVIVGLLIVGLVARGLGHRRVENPI